MKEFIKYLLGLATALLTFASCSDFLDQNPDLRTTLDSEEKVASILISAYTTGAGSYQILAELSSDNACDHGSHMNYNQFYKDVYEWAEDVASNNDSPGNVWSSNYSNIAEANQALSAINDLGGPVTEQLKASKGEALLCRAYSHFILANLFCMPYNEATADNYLGIPYMDHAETDLNPKYQRGTLREVYEKIGKDIEEGIPLINDNLYKVPKYHFNYKAACCFASRYYLFMHNWDKAIEYAKKAMTDNLTLRDYDAIAAIPDGTPRHQEYVNSASAANFLVQAATSAAGTVFGRYSTAGRYGHGEIIGTYETFASQKIDPIEQADGTLKYFANGAPWGSPSFKVNRVVLSSSRKYLLPRTWYVFQYTDPVAGTGFSKAVSVLFSVEEAILNYVEANIMKMSEDPTCGDEALRYLNIWAGNLFTSNTSNMTKESLVNWLSHTGYSEPYVGKTSSTSPQTLTPKKRLYAAPYAEIDARDDSDEQKALLHTLIFARRYQFLHEGMRWFDTRRFGITVYRYLLDQDDKTILQITDKISDESGIADPRRALQLPSDVIFAGLTPNPRN